MHKRLVSHININKRTPILHIVDILICTVIDLDMISTARGVIVATNFFRF